MKNSEHTAHIENLSNEGRGVARIKGKATFIQGALPGEEVRFKYTRVKKDFDEGRMLSVLQASELRIDPKCPHYDHCGGCSLQHLSTEQQIHFKQAQLIDLLQRFGRTEAQEIVEPLMGAHWNYRNKARLSVRYVAKKQATMVGFREKINPRFITEISQCPILHAKVDADIVALRNLIDSLDDKQSIAQIEVAAGDDEVALIFRNLNTLSVEDQSKIKDFAAQHKYKVFLQPKGPDSVYCIYPSQTENYLSYSLPEYTIRFEFQPTDFTQINASLNQLMVAQALEWMDLQAEDSVLDLFCGLGNFSLPMSKFCANVMGIEGSKEMVARALRNAEKNQLSNLNFYAANLDDVEEIKQKLQGSFSKVLIDPPRSGALEIVKHIELITPQRIVYVSCNPVTLARDTDILVNQKGYVLKKAGVLDMFPHTAHVESMALFEKG